MVDGQGGDLPGWMGLGEDPPREIAFGAIGKYWQLDITWLDPVPKTAEEFAAFDEPGWGKIAANLSVRPYGEGRSLLSYEARTAMTDVDSRTKFGRYWTVVSPFVGVIMRATLQSVKVYAEGPDSSELHATVDALERGRSKRPKMAISPSRISPGTTSQSGRSTHHRACCRSRDPSRAAT